MHAKAGVIDLWGRSGESRLAYLCSTQVQLRGDLLMCAVCASYPSVGVSCTMISKIILGLTVNLSFIWFLTWFRGICETSLLCPLVVLC